MLNGARSKLAALAAAGMLLAGATQAYAIDLPGQPDRNQLAREGRFNELQILQSRQNRIEFQAEQQRFREQDRQIVVPQIQRPDVPMVKPSCQIQLFGNIYRRVCR
ncbi:hypothetical protein ACFFTN_10980 [Aminobacter aganoensis]|uniref:Uncharacterized protein n=1 Tax=Aminobacter aganoensis TaxID=83264 RepID=A0A7X0FBT1_9HYPH|nr:hypothetical protein [Aminobacter aganoensis]MBB6356633.1 hypothetical protein [Aminobacter aganoensis]